MNLLYALPYSPCSSFTALLPTLRSMLPILPYAIICKMLRSDGQKKKILIIGRMPALMHCILKSIAEFLVSILNLVLLQELLFTIILLLANYNKSLMTIIVVKIFLRAVNLS